MPRSLELFHTIETEVMKGLITPIHLHMHRLDGRVWYEGGFFVKPKRIASVGKKYDYML